MASSGSRKGAVGGGRALRVCDHCLGVDDHPRHSFAGGVPEAYPAHTAEAVRRVAAQLADVDDADADRVMREFLDTGTLDLHLDCCRERGCLTGECDQRTAGAEDLRGPALYRHLIKLTEE